MSLCRDILESVKIQASTGRYGACSTTGQEVHIMEKKKALLSSLYDLELTTESIKDVSHSATRSL